MKVGSSKGQHSRGNENGGGGKKRERKQSCFRTVQPVSMSGCDSMVDTSSTLVQQDLRYRFISVCNIGSLFTPNFAVLFAAVTVCKTKAVARGIPYSSLLGRRFTMNKMLTVPAAVAIAAVLAGCAVPGPYYAAQPTDPYQWRTVSVTPVAPGTVAREGSTVRYTTEELPPAPTVTYVPQPVYVPAPVYAPAPAYYYPPVSIGLDFVFSNRHWGGGGRGWGHGYGRGWGRR